MTALVLKLLKLLLYLYLKYALQHRSSHRLQWPHRLSVFLLLFFLIIVCQCPSAFEERLTILLGFFLVGQFQTCFWLPIASTNPEIIHVYIFVVFKLKESLNFYFLLFLSCIISIENSVLTQLGYWVQNTRVKAFGKDLSFCSMNL